jgi:hypothetical protein
MFMNGSTDRNSPASKSSHVVEAQALDFSKEPNSESTVTLRVARNLSARRIEVESPKPPRPAVNPTAYCRLIFDSGAQAADKRRRDARLADVALIKGRTWASELVCCLVLNQYSTARASPVDRDFKNEVFSSFEPNLIQACTTCGNKPAQVMSLLDPLTGRTVRMFKCDCGEQTWLKDK